MKKQRLGSIEAGGTKFVLAVGDSNFHTLEKKRIPTTTPDETLHECLAFFQAHPVDALGIGSFGPIDLKPQSPTYGQILKTPKPGWSDAPVVDVMRQLNIPISFTTDVNASAYGEYVAGAGREATSLVYFTIGTGVGGGAVQDDHIIGGRAHPEMGHMLAHQHPDDHYAGGCPFHKNQCFEGLAAGPTILARTGKRGETLSRDNQVFDFISYYAAQMAFNAYLTLAPEKIVFGGSVLGETELPKIKRYFSQLNHDYVSLPDLDQLIVMTQVPHNGAATIGDFALAQKALD